MVKTLLCIGLLRRPGAEPRPLSRGFLCKPFWINGKFSKPRNINLKILFI
jgi:hypothetical protein